jgi:hypothetical protein
MEEKERSIHTHQHHLNDKQKKRVLAFITDDE